MKNSLPFPRSCTLNDASAAIVPRRRSFRLSRKASACARRSDDKALDEEPRVGGGLAAKDAFFGFGA